MELIPAPRIAEPQLGPDAAPVIPPGYKQTEVGVIPEEWSIRRLDEFAELLSSKRIFESDYVPSGVPFYRGKEITELIENSPIGDECFISDTRYDEIRKKYGAPGKGDILITAVGTLGNVYRVPNDRPFYFKDGNVIWLRNIIGIDGKYLSIQLTNRKDHIVGNAIGSSQKALTIVTLKQTFVPLPPTLAEQQAIAAALGDVDAYIDALAQRIAKQRLVKQGAMQELLRPKDGWVTATIGAIFSLSGTASKSGVLSDVGRFVVMDMGSVSQDGKVLTSKKTDVHLDVLNTGDLIMPKDDIGGGQIIGKVAFIDKDDTYVLGDHVYRLRKLHVESDAFFFHQLINSSYVHDTLKAKVVGSAQLGLGRKSVLEQTVSFPESQTEQTAIAEVLSDMDATIEALEAKLAKARLVKQGMMQALLTGRVRLV